MGGRQLSHQIIRANGIRLHVVVAGPVDGPLVVLLHGFPEFWWGWRKQIAYLAAAGYRVMAPDLRGYNLSDKPRGVEQYNVGKGAVDVVGLIEAAGREQAFVVGHDFGGSVAWRTAQLYPQNVARMVILNVPHHVVLRRNFFKLKQLPRSWYVFFFQLAWLPEIVLRAGNWQALAAGMVATSRPGTFSEGELDEYRRAWARPGAMTAMLNWYRAAGKRPNEGSGRSPQIRVPTLILWGARDVALDRSLASESVALCDDGRLIFFEEATHWLQHEEAQRVNPLIAEFLV